LKHVVNKLNIIK